MNNEKKEAVRCDMNDLTNDMNDNAKFMEEKKVQAELAKKAQQQDVLMQIGEKERSKKREYQETMFEQRAMKLAEMEYQRKIGDDIKRNKEILKGYKLNRPF